MWNYYFAVQSTFILGIILVFYFSLPRLSIRMNRTFVYMLMLQSLFNPLGRKEFLEFAKNIRTIGI